MKTIIMLPINQMGIFYFVHHYSGFGINNSHLILVNYLSTIFHGITITVPVIIGVTNGLMIIGMIASLISLLGTRYKTFKTSLDYPSINIVNKSSQY